jgi:hypothetical protein
VTTKLDIYVLLRYNDQMIMYCLYKLLFDSVQHHAQQYFSCIVAVSFIGGGNRSIRRKPSTCRCNGPLTDKHSKLLHIKICFKLSFTRKMCDIRHTKTDRHDTTEILLSMVLNTIKQQFIIFRSYSLSIFYLPCRNLIRCP